MTPGTPHLTPGPLPVCSLGDEGRSQGTTTAGQTHTSDLQPPTTDFWRRVFAGGDDIIGGRLSKT